MVVMIIMKMMVMMTPPDVDTHCIIWHCYVIQLTFFPVYSTTQQSTISDSTFHYPNVGWPIYQCHWILSPAESAGVSLHTQICRLQATPKPLSRLHPQRWGQRKLISPQQRHLPLQQASQSWGNRWGWKEHLVMQKVGGRMTKAMPFLRLQLQHATAFTNNGGIVLLNNFIFF